MHKNPENTDRDMLDVALWCLQRFPELRPTVSIGIGEPGRLPSQVEHYDLVHRNRSEDNRGTVCAEARRALTALGYDGERADVCVAYHSDLGLNGTSIDRKLAAVERIILAGILDQAIDEEIA